MNLCWVPYWIMGGIALVMLSVAQYSLNALPLDDDLAYVTMLRQLSRPDMVGDPRPNLSPMKILHRNGEVIVSGDGWVSHARTNAQGVTMRENLRFDYIMIVSRQCRELHADCYAADQVAVIGEKQLLPML